MPKEVKAIRVGKANGLEIDGKVEKAKRVKKAKVETKAARKAVARKDALQGLWHVSPKPTKASATTPIVHTATTEDSARPLRLGRLTKLDLKRNLPRQPHQGKKQAVPDSWQSVLPW